MKDFGKYGDIIVDLEGNLLFGIIIDDSRYLRDLARQAVEIQQKFDNPIPRIANLVGLNLASTWTFNDKELECGSGDFPNTLSKTDQQRWYVGLRDPDCISAIENVESEKEMRLLSTQLENRVGDCATYSLTLGVLLKAADVQDQVELVANPPHIFVAINGGEQFIDLARRSHGKLEVGEEKEKMHRTYNDDETFKLSL